MLRDNIATQILKFVVHRQGKLLMSGFHHAGVVVA